MTDTAPLAATADTFAGDADEADEAENYVDHRKNGGAHLVIDGEKRRLRTPRMRDYRKLYALWSDLADELDKMSVELQAFLLEVMGQGDEREARGEPRITEDEKARDRHLAQRVREATEDAAMTWWAECIRTLGVTPSDRDVEADELPVFLSTAESINQMLDHWRTVPSRSGAR